VTCEGGLGKHHATDQLAVKHADWLQSTSKHSMLPNKHSMLPNKHSMLPNKHSSY